MSYHPSCDDEITKLQGLVIPDGLRIGAHATVRDGQLFHARLLSDLRNGGQSEARAAVYGSKEVRRALAEPQDGPRKG